MSEPNQAASIAGLPHPCPGYGLAGLSEGPWVWGYAPDEWRVGGNGRTCRARGCLTPAVLRLNRWQHRRGKGRVPMWWHYCAEHSYGRVVYQGRVWEPKRPDWWHGALPNGSTGAGEPRA